MSETVCVLKNMDISQGFEIQNCFLTSAEREVKDSRRPGMSQSLHFWYKIGHAKSVGFRFYSD